MLFPQTDDFLITFEAGHTDRHKNAAVFDLGAGRVLAIRRTIHLESAAFVFHMSAMQPESSGQRELRVP
jgi:hypothetical protein